MKYQIEIDPGIASEETVIDFLSRLSFLSEKAGLGSLKVETLEKKTTRHPSEITLDEFKKIAHLFGDESIDSYEWYIQPFIRSERMELQANGYSNYFAIDWSGQNGFHIYKYALSGFENPGFSQSLKIAAYLDSIGIEYRAKKLKK